MEAPIGINRKVAALLLVLVFLVSAPPVSALGSPLDTHVSESNELESFSGAAFSTPESLEDEVEDLRGRTPRNLASNAFVLANHDSIYLVFTDKEPTSGRAIVEGQSLPRGITENGIEFNVIVANSASFETEGMVTTVSNVADNPSDYQQELVRIKATHRQVSILNDPDKRQNVTATVSSGVLVDGPTTTNEILSRPGQKTRSLSINTSTNELGSNADQEINELLSTDQERLYTVDFEEHYWNDVEQTVDGIVLTAGSKAREFVSTFDKTGIAKTDTDSPLLYVVHREAWKSRFQYDSIQTVKSRGLGGELVEITANLTGSRISTQETLRTATPCGNSQVQVPTPNGPVCIDVLQDSVIDLGVIWTSTPSSSDDLLFVAGISSQHLDQPSKQLRGEYRIVGEVVSPKRFDESLPEGKMLVIYDLERTGDIDYQGLAPDTQDTIESRAGVISSSIVAQITGDSDTVQTTTSRQTEQNPTKETPSENPATVSENTNEAQPDPTTDTGSSQSILRVLNQDTEWILFGTLILALLVFAIVLLVVAYLLALVKTEVIDKIKNVDTGIVVFIILFAVGSTVLVAISTRDLLISLLMAVFIGLGLVPAIVLTEKYSFSSIPSDKPNINGVSMTRDLKRLVWRAILWLSSPIIGFVLGIVLIGIAWSSFAIVSSFADKLVGLFIFLFVIAATIVTLVAIYYRIRVREHARREDSTDGLVSGQTEYQRVLSIVADSISYASSASFSLSSVDIIGGIVGSSNEDQSGDFIADLRCENCGNSWSRNFKRGDRVLQKNNGVVFYPRESGQNKIFCPVCAIPEEVYVEDREPVE